MPSTFHWSRRRLPSPSAPAPLPVPIGAPGWLAAAPCWRWAVHWVHSHCRVRSQRRNACLVRPEHFLWYSVPQVAQHNGRRWARILPLQAGHFLRFLGLPAAPALFPGLGVAFTRGLRGGVPGLFAPAPAPPGEILGDGKRPTALVLCPPGLSSILRGCGVRGAGLLGPDAPPSKGAVRGRTSGDLGDPPSSIPTLTSPGVLTLPWYLGFPATPTLFPGLGVASTRGLRDGVPGLFTPAPAPPDGILGDGNRMASIPRGCGVIGAGLIGPRPRSSEEALRGWTSGDPGAPLSSNPSLPRPGVPDLFIAPCAPPGGLGGGGLRGARA